MATNYPGSLDTGTEQPSPLSTTEMDDAGFEHDVVHTNHSGAIIALETKVGTGSSTAVANSVLAGTGAGTSAWTTGTLANSISGNAATATALETARTINGTSFDGTANITVTAAAGTLTGSTLASGVTASSLTSVGTLTGLTVSGDANFDSGTLFVDVSANRVGIKDTTPSYELDVAGQIRATSNIRGGAFLMGTSDDGLKAVTGQYGSVQTTGTGAGNYEGYSINGHFVFMSANTEACGIYNDVDNRWMLLMDNDSYTRLYDSRTGITIGGNPATTTGGGSGGNGYVGINNECGGFSGTTCVVTTTTVAGTTLKRLGFSASSYEFKSGIEDLAMSDEAFMSLRPITFHPNDQYVDSTGEVTQIVGGHTIVPDQTEAGETDGLMPLRRAGFGLEDLYGRDDTMILASEFSPDPMAMVALLTQKLQETMTRVAALEAA